MSALVVALVRSIGARHIIDYTRQDVSDGTCSVICFNARFNTTLVTFRNVH